MHVIAVLVLQYVVSATAGLVDQVRGDINLKQGQMVTAGTTVETGDNGLVDLQLNPGAYLRLRPHSAAVFTSTALATIEFEITKGIAVVDLADSDPPFPIQVHAGAVNVKLRKSGIYEISPDNLKVLDGQVEISPGKLLRKGDAAAIGTGDLKLTKLKKEELRHPYAPDRLKLYVEAKPDKDNKPSRINGMFVELVKQNFREVHDIEIADKAEGADYILTIAASKRGGRGGQMGMFGEIELRDSAGKVIYSNQHDELDDKDATQVTSGDLFVGGNPAAAELVRDLMNRTGWR